jgi:hypothetical protein
MMRNLDVFFLSLIFFSSMPGSAFDLRETPKEASINSQDFPQTGFSFSKCSSRIPVKKGKNPWLRVVKKQTKPAPMNPAPVSWTESYFVAPADKEKSFSIINQEDSVYSSPSTLARIDCKNGLIYFQHLVREPTATNFFRVFDLLSGTEYQVTEGAVTISPDGKYMMTTSAQIRDQKCGQSSNCEVSIKLYQCNQRKLQGIPCELQSEKKISVSDHGRNTSFSPLPLRWNWNKYRKVLDVSIGGYSRSPSRINCSILPKFDCTVAKKGTLEFSFKE